MHQRSATTNNQADKFSEEKWHYRHSNVEFWVRLAPKRWFKGNLMARSPKSVQLWAFEVVMKFAWLWNEYVHIFCFFWQLQLANSICLKTIRNWKWSNKLIPGVIHAATCCHLRPPPLGFAAVWIISRATTSWGSFNWCSISLKWILITLANLGPMNWFPTNFRVVLLF